MAVFLSLSLSLSLSLAQAEGKHWHNPKVYLMQVSCKDDIVQQRSSKTFATPTSKSEIASAATSISRSFRETIHLSTLTCSTKLTQKSKLGLILRGQGLGGQNKEGGFCEIYERGNMRK